MRNRTLLFALLILAAFPAWAENALGESFWGRVAARSGVKPSVLYGIAVQESGMRWRDGTFRPWPWTLNLNKGETVHINGRAVSLGPGPRRYQSLEEAQSALDGFIQQGVTNIDVGLMQVNLRWHGHRVGHPLQLLDPRTNLAVAAAILREENWRSESLHQAVGRYHSQQSERGARYARRVLSYAELFDGKN